MLRTKDSQLESDIIIVSTLVVSLLLTVLYFVIL